jgi:hypothetical protein
VKSAAAVNQYWMDRQPIYDLKRTPPEMQAETLRIASNAIR